MQRSFVLSALFHLILLALFLGGIPFFSSPLKQTRLPALSVELIPLDKKTNLTSHSLKKEVIKEKIKKKEIKKPLAQSKQTQKNAKKSDLKPKSKPKAKSEIKPKAKSEIKPKPAPPKMKAKPKPKPKAEIKEKITTSSPSKMEPIPPQSKPAPKKQEDPLEALFKDLDRKKAELTKRDKAKKTPPQSRFEQEQKLTLSEKDALIHQIQSNWHYVAGSYDHVPIFQIMIHVNEKAEPLSVTLLTPSILTSPKGKSCFESIKRAIFRSSPLHLPLDKSDNWLDGVRVTIDPRNAYFS